MCCSLTLLLHSCIFSYFPTGPLNLPRVDSSVCSALLLAALPPEQIHCLHVDHGFMRQDESAGVVRALQKIGLKVVKVDASKDFAEARTVIDGEETEQLQITLNPEVKRKIIGDTFMHVSEKVSVWSRFCCGVFQTRKCN